jgi:hypothetical protein
VTKPDGNRDSAIERLLRDTLEARAASTQHGQCLDADTLAAWADDGLSAGERSTVEAHAADCAPCQALLAAMARTTPPPETSRPWWQVHRIRWLVPLAGIGAAVIVWTVVPDRQNARPSELPPPPVDAVVKAPAPPDLNTPERSQLERRAAPRVAEERRPALADETGRVAPADKKETASANETMRTDSFARQAPAPAAPAAVPQAAAGGAPSSAVAERETLSRARASASVGDTMIVSSNPGSRWRIVPNGVVQRSADGGSTWQTQQTGVAVTLIAGASPSPSVCWLVGPGGIVLLSTDGQSWRRVTFPEPTDLVAVRATDDKTATVTTADGRAFSTDDGGLTWTRAPAQEFPAAPF